jgi:lysophospholipase L1-like esterase
MTRRIAFLTLVCLSVVALARISRAAEPGHDFAKWEKEVAALEAQDKINPPPKGEILFIGSSTVKRWTTLAQDFPQHKVINRGFGGTQIVDATYYADRLIFPHEPKLIFLRAGGNDLNAGKTAVQVFADYQEFVAKIQARLPKTEVVFISLSPSISRWKQADKEKAVNDMVQKFIAGKPGLKYVETYDMVLGKDGMPREELFVADKLHFNGEGYKLFAERIRPSLPK